MEETVEALGREVVGWGPLVTEYAIQAAGAFLILVLGFIVAGILSRWTRNGLSRIRTVDETLARFLSKVVQYGVIVLVVVTALTQFGVATTSILAALGAAGLAIGLALQGTLSNIAAGVMLLVLRPFRVGEFIEAGGILGTVVEIGLFTTELRHADGRYLMAPNSNIWNQTIINYSRNPTRRVEVTVGIDYEDDIEKARATLLSLVESDGRVLAEPAPNVFVANLNDSSVDLTLWAWTATPDFFATQNDVRRRAKEKFDEEAISIPFPQQVITYRGEPPPASS